MLQFMGLQRVRHKLLTEQQKSGEKHQTNPTEEHSTKYLTSDVKVMAYKERLRSGGGDDRG